MVTLLDTKVSTIKLNLKFTIKSALVFFLALFLTYQGFDQASLQWKFRTLFPSLDMVTIIRQLDATPSPTILDLAKLAAFSEHLNLAPYALYLWDRIDFASSGELLFRAIYIFNSLLILSFLFSLRGLKHKLGAGYSALFTAIIFYWSFAAFHYESLTWQIMVCEIVSLVCLSFGLLLAAMVSADEDAKRTWVRDVILAGFAGVALLTATFSFGFGLVGWPLVFVHAILMRWRIAPLVVLGAIAAWAIGIYAYWYVAILDVASLRAHTSLSVALSQPLDVAKVSLNVLSWPPSYIFEVFTSLRLARLLGIATILVSCGLAATCIARLYLTKLGYLARRPTGRLSFHAAMIVVAALGMSLMIGLARVNWYHSFGESRYAVVSSVFACGLLTLLVLELQSVWAKRCMVVFGILTAIMSYVSSQRDGYTIAERDQKLFQAGVLATFRLDFWPRMPSLYWGSPAIYDVWHRSRSPDSSYAEREPFKWIGSSVSDLPQAKLAVRCLGHVDSVVALVGEPEVIRLEGWALVADDYLRWVLVSDDNNNVVGAGRPGLPSQDVRNHLKAAGEIALPRQSRTAKFEIAAVVDPSRPLVLWGVTSNGEACRAATVRSR